MNEKTLEELKGILLAYGENRPHRIGYLPDMFTKLKTDGKKLKLYSSAYTDESNTEATQLHHEINMEELINIIKDLTLEDYKKYESEHGGTDYGKMVYDLYIRKERGFKWYKENGDEW